MHQHCKIHRFGAGIPYCFDCLLDEQAAAEAEVECEECNGTGKRSFYECDELVDCIDCNGTGKVSKL